MCCGLCVAWFFYYYAFNTCHCHEIFIKHARRYDGCLMVKVLRKANI